MIASRKATFQSESSLAPEPFAQPRLAVIRANRFLCNHIRVFSGWAIQGLSDFRLHYAVREDLFADYLWEGLFSLVIRFPAWAVRQRSRWGV